MKIQGLPSSGYCLRRAEGGGHFGVGRLPPRDGRPSPRASRAEPRAEGPRHTELCEAPTGAAGGQDRVPGHRRPLRSPECRSPRILGCLRSNRPPLARALAPFQHHRKRLSLFSKPLKTVSSQSRFWGRPL